MEFNLIINKIKELESILYPINNIISKTLRTMFLKLNNDDFDILLTLLIFLLNILSNKFNITTEYWKNNIKDIKATILLLLPFINDNTMSELFNLNEILFNNISTNKISSFIKNIDKDTILSQYFKFSTISLGLIDSNTELNLYENNEPLIFKLIHHNLIGLLQTLEIINGKLYINWINIIPLDINNYHESLLYINTQKKIQFLSEHMYFDSFKNIITNNLLNYNGLWFGDLYNVIRIKYYENFNKIYWLLFPDDHDEKYLIHKLNDYFNLEYILNLDYYNYNDLPVDEKNKFIKLLNTIKPDLLILEKFLIYFTKYDKNKNKIDDFDKYFNEIKISKIDLLWNILKKLIVSFNNSVYGKFLLNNKKFYNNYYYKPFNTNIIININQNINLYTLYNIIKRLIYLDKEKINHKHKLITLDLNFISLNISNKFLFFRRLYDDNYYLNTWLKLDNDNDNEYLNDIFNYFKDIFIPLIFEELITTGILSSFVDNNKTFNNNTYYYLTNNKYDNDYLKQIKENKFTWINYYAMNWIAQINFFHHYIYHQIIYITGATGQGKTTQIPKLLLFAEKAINYKSNTKIVCSEPRIGPTVDNAIRVAEELGYPIISSDKKLNNYYIQYKYKEDMHANNITTHGFVKYITDGSLLEEIINNLSLYVHTKDNISNIPLYDIIIIDEAHEHNVYMDILITLIRTSCYMNNKIKLIIMSATMDTDEPIYRRYFQNINDNFIFPIKNHLYHPFNNTYLFLPNPLYMDRRYHISPPGESTQYKIIDNYLNEDIDFNEGSKQGLLKVLDICNQTLKGGILFFSIGENEIKNIIKELNIKLPFNCIALPLYSELNIQYKEIITNININIYNIQNKKENIYIDWGNIYIDKKDVPKGTYNRFIIVATNIAEASITIPDLKYVIDVGYIKNNKYDYKLNLSNFTIDKISEVSRIQRRGRVGRISDGIVYYMYKYKSREIIKPLYKICYSNIDNIILKILADNNCTKLLDKYYDPNIYENNKNILKIEDNIHPIIKIIQKNYIINNNSLSIDYYLQNNNDLFYLYNSGYNLEIIKDCKGIFYLIHPNENNFKRNIYNEILNNSNNVLLPLNRLIEFKLIENNYKTILGNIILKNMRDINNINEAFIIYYGNKYNCYNDIIEINNFLNIINYSLVELINKNITWDEFKQVYKNYNSDIIFIYDLIYLIKNNFKNLFTNIINIKSTIINSIDNIKTHFINNNFNNYDIKLFNKLNELKNNGTFNLKYKILIFNSKYIQNIFKNHIKLNMISSWCDRNLFNENKILLILKKMCSSLFKITNNDIIINNNFIYNQINKDIILKSYLYSYKDQIAYPKNNTNYLKSQINIAPSQTKLNYELETVINISYFKLFYLKSNLSFNKENINITILSNFSNKWLE